MFVSFYDIRHARELYFGLSEEWLRAGVGEGRAVITARFCVEFMSPDSCWSQLGVAEVRVAPWAAGRRSTSPPPTPCGLNLSSLVDGAQLMVGIVAAASSAGGGPGGDVPPPLP